MDKLLPPAAMEKVMKKVASGYGMDDVRVSEEAKALLKEMLEQRGQAIAIQAVKLATHAKRDTVKKRDVVLGAKLT